MALSTVAALGTDPVAMFETAIACEVFGLDRTDDGVPPFTFMMCGETAGVPVPTTSGGALTPTHQWQDALDKLSEGHQTTLGAYHRSWQ